MADLRIDVSDTGSPTVVVLSGEVELSTAGRLRDVLNAVGASGATDIVIDLRDASFVDTTGLGILLGSVDRLQGNGRVLLRSPSPEVREIVRRWVVAGSVDIEPPTTD